jgi:hypothetical protein
LFNAGLNNLISEHPALRTPCNKGDTVLRWTMPTTAPLISNAASARLDDGSGVAPTRYGVHNLTISVEASSKSFVLDVGGHGVRIDGVTVEMSHSLTSAASTVHTTGTGFSIMRSNITHDQLTCTSPGYPRDCLLFFDAGTDSGVVAGNTFRMGCVRMYLCRGCPCMRAHVPPPPPPPRARPPAYNLYMSVSVSVRVCVCVCVSVSVYAPSTHGVHV